MKKLLCVLMTLAVLTALLSGCGLFTSNTAQSENDTSGNAPIQVSEKLSFEDPKDIEFDKRYVIACDESSAIVAAAADYGMKASYDIIYAKDDKPVAAYNFLVVDTEEHAKALIELYATQGSVIKASEQDPIVLTSFTEGETMEGTLVSYQSFGMISEATVSAYVEFYSQSIGGKVE